MRALLDRVRSTADPDCRCEGSADAGTLCVDASACPGGGALTDQPACRETVATAARRHAPDRVVVDAGGFERAFDEQAAALFTAAGRFAARAADRDQRLAERARSDPLAAAREATGRPGPVAALAAETGFGAVAAEVPAYDALLAHLGPSLADARVDPSPPSGGRLRDARELETGTAVREYEVPDALAV